MLRWRGGVRIASYHPFQLVRNTRKAAAGDVFRFSQALGSARPGHRVVGKAKLLGETNLAFGLTHPSWIGETSQHWNQSRQNGRSKFCLTVPMTWQRVIGESLMFEAGHA